MSATEILVVILSSALAIFLVLSIILVILLIRVTKQIQAITNTAKTAVDNLQNITANVSKVVAPAALMKMVKDLVSHAKSKD